MLALYMLSSRVCVCLSVRPSHASIVPKLLNSANFQQGHPNVGAKYRVGVC